MKNIYLKKIVESEYKINITNIEKNKESTVGNVYIVYSEDKKYVLKIYDDLSHTKSMVLLYEDLSSIFNIPKVIKNICNKGYVKVSDSKYIVLYSFLDGIQIRKLDNLNKKLIKQIAAELRKLHELTNTNKYKLKTPSYLEKYNINRESLLHFDLTKGNIFYNSDIDKIGFIDFDDAKYGPGVCDVAIAIALLFFSKKRGADNESLNLFIDTYYDDNLSLRDEEVKYIKELSIKWIDYVLNGNEFDSSLKESFEVKKKLIEEKLIINSIKLIPFKETINEK